MHSLCVQVSVVRHSSTIQFTNLLVVRCVMLAIGGEWRDNKALLDFYKLVQEFPKDMALNKFALLFSNR